MPIYEYRCESCGQISTTLASINAIPTEVACEHCAKLAPRILSRPSVHLSARSNTDRRAPPYEKRGGRAL
ncbi:MAG: zinc ribbon domain-containing protein, partial [Gammaproteobacteria bacterium]|nr:zinc ribbon domain-containing protein [Gammaproteobacteria bacterium]